MPWPALQSDHAHLAHNSVSIAYHDIPITGLRNRIGDFTVNRNGFKVAVEDEHRGIEILFRVLRYEEYADEPIVWDTARMTVEEDADVTGCFQSYPVVPMELYHSPYRVYMLIIWMARDKQIVY
ncbi:hypothetical protein GGP41_008628 [Bipolaris sorokiniana]|uniref:Uncharacterized protein n=1 Tax=Cochliobolus sativus TaxID=45130 RepID=A0A8H5ZBA6_COCSA|nr:hypothetical protein GGP41_008628 [Bipolaris sorokiniana]